MAAFNDEMFVTKRDCNQEIVSFDKILERIKKISNTEPIIKINYTSLAMKVIDQLYNGISTTKIDELSAEQCASMASIHPDYNILAGRIIISNHHKNTSNSFGQVMTQLYQYKDKHDKHSPLVSQEFIDTILENPEVFESICQYDRDYLIDYFGYKTLERAYLMKIDKIIVERPQHMWLRVAIGIHGNNIDKIKETYDCMSQKYFTHATPTLFNAGTPHPQLSSCYLIAMESDSIDGIYNTLKDCALISKWAGGIGLHIHNVRASGSHIRGTNGASNGIVPMLKVFNNTAKYVDQCVTPDSIIYTTGGPIKIQDCVPGITQIFGETGQAETIKRVLEHAYKGPMLRIQSALPVDALQITPEHPVYILHKTQYEHGAKDLDRSFEWTDAKDVCEGDWLIYPVPTLEIDFEELTPEICYIYGIILAGLINYQESPIANADPKCMYTRNSPEYEHVLGKFLTKNHIPHDTCIVEGYNILSWKQTTNLPFSKQDFFTYNGSIAIGMRWQFLPLHKTQQIINGLDNTTYLDSTIFLQYLRLRMVKTIKPNITFSYTNPESNKSYVLVKINNISETQYDGTLYDLQMTTEHNYLLKSGGLVHNGGGKRNGSFAIYLEPWHADIEMFLQMRKNHGDEELKARDLFYALWIPDLFMERIKTNGKWTLMCPDECPGLADVYGQDFVDLYNKYEDAGKGRQTINARDLWFQILDAQMETGTPYILYKDACNRKSNQQNLGVIKSSNLCSEVVQYSSENETAVCNLASIALPTFINNVTPNQQTPVFDYEKLHAITKIVTYNLNRIIDVNFYPTDKTERSNKRHRPIGIGIQGLADVFMIMNMPFTSDAAKQLNKHIFETIYHAALEQSCEMAISDGPYETFDGSPASKGILQFDMWNVDPTNARYDWTALKNRIKIHGLRNSLLLAPMPTASTSQILGFNECIEPITSNIYNRRTIAGEFILANKYLMNDLINLGMWNEKVKNSIIANHGSIQHIDIIPLEIREKYKTVWEIPMRHLIDMSADRGAYICQSQSLNLWLEDPNYSTLTSMHFHSWAKGLKTGIYYLRRRGRHQAQQFTIEPEKNNSLGKTKMLEPDICDMCSS